MTREDHVNWCKERAHEYFDKGNIPDAITSMTSDMNKRDDTKVNPTLAMLGMLAVMNNGAIEAKRFVDGFR